MAWIKNVLSKLNPRSWKKTDKKTATVEERIAPETGRIHPYAQDQAPPMRGEEEFSTSEDRYEIQSTRDLAQTISGQQAPTVRTESLDNSARQGSARQSGQYDLNQAPPMPGEEEFSTSDSRYRDPSGLLQTVSNQQGHTNTQLKRNDGYEEDEETWEWREGEEDPDTDVWTERDLFNMIENYVGDKFTRLEQNINTMNAGMQDIQKYMKQETLRMKKRKNQQIYRQYAIKIEQSVQNASYADKKLAHTQVRNLYRTAEQDENFPDSLYPKLDDAVKNARDRINSLEDHADEIKHEDNGERQHRGRRNQRPARPATPGDLVSLVETYRRTPTTKTAKEIKTLGADLIKNRHPLSFFTEHSDEGITNHLIYKLAVKKAR